MQLLGIEMDSPFNIQVSVGWDKTVGFYPLSERIGYGGGEFS